jgi:transcriptional regulator with XRE-family HTH domain
MSVDIKARRKELGLSQQEVGDYVGVSSTTVGRWENGQIKDMKRDSVKKLSEILNVSPLDLIGGDIDLNDISPATRLLLQTISKADEDDIMRIVLVARAMLS